ncbi:hypothetical protein SNEBB_000455, partial [Seison nebaliae]
NKRNIRGKVNLHIWNQLQQFAFRKSERESTLHKRRLNHKLDGLINSSVWSRFSNRNLINNVSSRRLTNNEKEILGFGLSFSHKPGANIGIDVLSSSHEFINKLPVGQRSPSLIGLLFAGFMTSLNQPHSIQLRYRNAIADLRNDDSIIVTKADKGNTIVILDRVDYNRKLNVLLQDDSTYAKLNRNPLTLISSTFNRKIKDILRGYNELKAEHFTVRNPRLPHMYGLPKTHKEGMPLRPIISKRRSPTFYMEKWLAKYLKPLLGTLSQAHLKNSLDFINKIKGSNFSHGKMASLDVKSLFTNVNVPLTLDFLKRKLTSVDIVLPVSVDHFILLLQACMAANGFSAGNDYYSQTDGLSMGSPLSPILANIFMEYVESELLSDILPDGVTYLRYVDDIFIFWPYLLTHV